MNPAVKVPITVPEVLEETTKIISFYEEVLDGQNAQIERLMVENRLLRKRTKSALSILKEALFSIRTKYLQ